MEDDPPRYTSASNPTITVAIDLEGFPRSDDYWVLLVAYADEHELICRGSMGLGEWKQSNPDDRLTVSTGSIARGTYIFRVVLQPFDVGNESLVSDSFVATV